MTALESLYVAILCMVIVMLVLACLFIIINVFSFGIRMFTKNKKIVNQNLVQTTSLEQKTDKESDLEQNDHKESDFSSGELKLHNVDERTAAMIMAIVSDESGIPLSELCFKSIKAIDNRINDSQEAIA